MRHSYHDGQVTFQRFEQRMFWVMKFFLYALLPAFAAFAVWKPANQILNVVVNVVVLVCFISVFVTLQYYLRKLHFFEYNRNFRANFLFFALVFTFSVVRIVDDLTQKYNTEVPECHTRFIQAFVLLIFNVTAWQSLSVNMIMIFVKSTNDILQGVSKLDNLLKVSRI